jgi:hypothetical protein
MSCTASEAQARKGESVNPDPLYNNDQAAEYLNVSPRTPEKWRWLGTGPEFNLIGNRPMYRQSSLEGYIASRRRLSTSDPGPTCTVGCGK